MIEKTFIEFFKPIFNIEGVKTEYEFKEKPRNNNEVFLDERLESLRLELLLTKEYEDRILKIIE